jgi:hypothetical protein
MNDNLEGLEICPRCYYPTLDKVVGEEYSRVCFHCNLYFSDIRKEHRKNTKRVLNHLSEGLELYEFEVHKGNQMVDYGEIFYNSYEQLQDIINHYFYECKATEIILYKKEDDQEWE